MKQNYQSYEIEIANLKKNLNDAQNHIIRLDNELENMQKDNIEELNITTHNWNEERNENEKLNDRLEQDNRDLHQENVFLTEELKKQRAHFEKGLRDLEQRVK